MTLSKRQESILDGIVELFMKTGEPVGSKAVCELLSNSCSTATIRNEMANLIDKGYLLQPHTSAGRIPSSNGYRFYVERNIDFLELDESAKQKVEKLMPLFMGDIEKFVFDVCSILADITKCTSIITTPYDTENGVKRVELIPMGNRLNVMAVLTSYDIMNSCVCKTDMPFIGGGLDLFTKAINEEFSGKPMSAISPASVQSFISKYALHSLTFAPLMECFQKIIKETMNPKIKIEGQSNLLFYRDFSTAEIREILTFLSHRENVYDLLNSTGDNLSVFFGSESDSNVLKDTALITARYSISDTASGKIGVLGPLRMDYCQILPIVKYIATLTENQIKASVRK